jgi:hypothetical protein
LQRPVGQSLLNQLGSGEARRDGIDPNACGSQFKRQRPGEPENAGFRRAIRPAPRQADKSSGRCDADDRAALAARHHARRRLGCAEKKAIEMGGDDRREVGERNLPDKPDALDAGVVDEDVDPIRPCIDRLEGGGDAGRIGHVGFEIVDPDARLGGRRLVEGENAGAVSEQPLGDGVAYAARCAGDDGDAPGKGIGHCHAPSGFASAQYISQPPLTLIVAPVT